MRYNDIVDNSEKKIQTIDPTRLYPQIYKHMLNNKSCIIELYISNNKNINYPYIE